jgi:molecular chaperone DnaK
VREALKNNDVEATKAAYEKLQTKFQEISAELYKHASAAGAEGSATHHGEQHQHESSAEPKKEGDVVDAEFEVVDDDKKKKK